jgi:beta-mannan synthase
MDGLTGIGLSLLPAGVLDLKQAQEWVVTTKLGSSDKRPGTGTSTPTNPVPVLRFYASEMMMSFFVLTAAFYGIFSVNKWSFSLFLTLQGARRPHAAAAP